MTIDLEPHLRIKTEEADMEEPETNRVIPITITVAASLFILFAIYLQFAASLGWWPLGAE